VNLLLFSLVLLLGSPGFALLNVVSNVNVNQGAERQHDVDCLHQALNPAYVIAVFFARDKLGVAEEHVDGDEHCGVIQ